MKKILLIVGLVFLNILSPASHAQESFSANIKYDELIPHYLLGLIHAPEVHKELKLSGSQVDDLESLLKDIDAQWFPSRILPLSKQSYTVRVLEQKVWSWFAENTSAQQQMRLRQLEYYAQSGRVLLRDDLGSEIGLQPSQVSRLADLASATDSVQQKLASTTFGDPAVKELQEAYKESKNAERTALSKIVLPEQRKKLAEILGPVFDATKLERVYAMAPEFAKVEHWMNSSPLTMESLRGKVVLVHFYAFQCHNCHANFEIYKRWHSELTDKGVVVVGIQTPETRSERDPKSVESAANEKGLIFPILLDLESKNWQAWGNTMWPTVYVVDKNGYIRHWWQGELNWKGATADKTIEKLVNRLLAEKI